MNCVHYFPAALTRDYLLAAAAAGPRVNLIICHHSCSHTCQLFTDKNIIWNQKYFCKSKLTFWLTAAMTSCDQPITGQIQTIKVSLTFRNCAPTQYSTIIKIFWILVFLHLWLWCLCSFSLTKLHQFYKNSKTFFGIIWKLNGHLLHKRLWLKVRVFSCDVVPWLMYNPSTKCAKLCNFNCYFVAINCIMHAPQ